MDYPEVDLFDLCEVSKRQASPRIESAASLMDSSLRAETLPMRLTNEPFSFRLLVDAFLHRQRGLSPFQQPLLLYGLSVCVRVL